MKLALLLVDNNRLRLEGDHHLCPVFANPSFAWPVLLLSKSASFPAQKPLPIAVPNSRTEALDISFQPAKRNRTRHFRWPVN